MTPSGSDTRQPSNFFTFKTNIMRTLVKFFKEPDGETLAVFTADEFRKNLFNGYSHDGQHTFVHRMYLRKCTPATKEEAAPLLKELESIDYKLIEDPDFLP